MSYVPPRPPSRQLMEPGCSSRGVRPEPRRLRRRITLDVWPEYPWLPPAIAVLMVALGLVVRSC